MTKSSRRRRAAGGLLTTLWLLACSDSATNPVATTGAAGSQASGGASGTGATAGGTAGGGAAGTGGAGASGAAGAIGWPVVKYPCRNSLPTGELPFWSEDFSLPGVSAQDGVATVVHDIAPDPYGGMLVAGDFHWAGKQETHGMALWTGTKLLSAGPYLSKSERPSGGFQAVAASAKGVQAYAPDFGGSPTQGAVWIADDSGGKTEIGRYQGRVRRLVWVGDTLWVAGAFTLDNGGPKQLATWDGAWHGAAGGDPDRAVFDVVADTDGSMLVGGEFTTIGGVTSPRVARWDGTTWSHELAMPAAQSTRVLTLARDASGRLHAGGAFTLGDHPSAGLARWDGGAWQIVGGGVAKGQTTGVVSQLLPDGDGLFVSGCFDHVQGTQDDPVAITTAGIARWDGATWQSLDDGSKPVGSLWHDSDTCGSEDDPESVWSMSRQRLAVHDGALLVGGSFGGLGGVASQSVISYRDGSWRPVGDAGQGLSGTLVQVRSGGPQCDLYGLAAATHAGGKPLTSPLLRLQNGWQEVGPALPSGVSCSRFEIDPVSSTPWLLCASDQTDGTGRLYRLTDDTWQVVAPELPPVTDLAFTPDGVLHVVGGAGKGFVARLEGEDFVPLGGDFDQAVFHLAFAPRAGGHDVLAAGPFTSVDGQEVRRVARWDGTAWNGLGEGATSTPSAIAAAPGVVYLATQDEGQPGRKVLARWDGTTWAELGDEAHGLPEPMPGTVHTFTSILPLESGFVASGHVWPVTGGRNVFFSNGTTLWPLEGGARATSVDSVAITGQTLWLAGPITAVGWEEYDALHASVGVACHFWGAGD